MEFFDKRGTMLKLGYQKINGTLYAKILGKSVRKNDKIIKGGVKI